VTGTPHTPAEQLTAFQHAWVATAAIAMTAGLTGYLLRRPQPTIEAPVELVTISSNIAADTDT
jgi:hypothetical protein